MGADGLVREVMTLGGMMFEVSWRPGKASVLLARRGIALPQAVRVLDDPGCAIEAASAPYDGQYRLTGYTPSSRLLTVAATIAYPDEFEDEGDVGMIRVHSAWDASDLERRFRHP